MCLSLLCCDLATSDFDNFLASYWDDLIRKLIDDKLLIGQVVVDLHMSMLFVRYSNSGTCS